MREQQEILDEIQRLEAIKSRVRRYTAFNDDNHAAIDAQIQVLVGRLSLNDIYDSWNDEDDEDFSQYVLDCALEAYNWMADSSERAPVSTDWELAC
jgi:hypothetical protein